MAAQEIYAETHAEISAEIVRPVSDSGIHPGYISRAYISIYLGYKSQGGHVDIVRLLLSGGAAVNAPLPTKQALYGRVFSQTGTGLVPRCI